MRCAVYGCKTKQRRNNLQCGVKMHSFPRDPHLREAWIEACGRTDPFNLVTAKICSKHFTDADCVRNLRHELLGYTPANYRPLKPDVIPTVNLPKEKAPSTTAESADERRKRLINDRWDKVNNLLKEVESRDPASRWKKVDELIKRAESSLNKDKVSYNKGILKKKSTTDVASDAIENTIESDDPEEECDEITCTEDTSDCDDSISEKKNSTNTVSDVVNKPIKSDFADRKSIADTASAATKAPVTGADIAKKRKKVTFIIEETGSCDEAFSEGKHTIDTVSARIENDESDDIGKKRKKITCTENAGKCDRDVFSSRDISTSGSVSVEINNPVKVVNIKNIWIRREKTNSIKDARSGDKNILENKNTNGTASMRDVDMKRKRTKDVGTNTKFDKRDQIIAQLRNRVSQLQARVKVLTNSKKIKKEL